MNERRKTRFVKRESVAYILVMPPDLSTEQARCLFEYAKRKFAEERWPLSPSLRPIREALAQLDPPKPLPEPKPARPYVPSSLAQKKRR